MENSLKEHLCKVAENSKKIDKVCLQVNDVEPSQKREIIRLVIDILKRANVPDSVIGVAYLASHEDLREAILKQVREYLKDA
nr:unnamed protein product [Callosobruchus analis]